MKKGGFCAQFYLCPVQSESVPNAAADQQEVEGLQWATPAEALQQLESHEISMAPPQFYILELLSRCPSFSSLPAFMGGPALQWVHSLPNKPFPVEGSISAGSATLSMPGDWAHPIYRGPSPSSRNRIVMEGGFKALQEGRPVYKLEQTSDLNLTSITQISGL